MLKKCKICEKKFQSKTANTLYCEECRKKQRALSATKTKKKILSSKQASITTYTYHEARDSGYF